MSADLTPERLGDAEREALHRAVAATINYHSFDAAAETADFDMADAIMDTDGAATSLGLASTVERILANRHAALLAEVETLRAEVASRRNVITMSDRARLRTIENLFDALGITHEHTEAEITALLDGCDCGGEEGTDHLVWHLAQKVDTLRAERADAVTDGAHWHSLAEAAEAERDRLAQVVETVRALADEDFDAYLTVAPMVRMRVVAAHPLRAALAPLAEGGE